MEVLETPEYFELTGVGYNIMLQKADQYGKFKIDLILEGSELDKAADISERLGLKIKDSLGYAGMEEGKPLDVKYITLSAKEQDGKYPRKFIPTKDDDDNIIKDFMRHGAKVTVRFKAYGYKGGTTNTGHKYSAGNGFQLEAVRVHEYEPYTVAA